MNKIVAENFSSMKSLLEEFSNETNFRKISAVGKLMAESLENGGRIISCGNGGSLSDAAHFAEELTGRFRKSRKPLSAVAITDPAYITCVANDFGYTEIFARYILANGRQGDVLLAISTSGNSENIIEAAKTAKKKKMRVVALTGREGGNILEYCDEAIIVPYDGYSDRIQEIHIKIIHTLVQLIENNMKLE